MNELYKELYSFLWVNAFVIWQAIFDFIGWFGFAKEDRGWKYSTLYRKIKGVHDFIIMAVIAFILLPWDIAIWIYLIKWAHGCDSWYNIFSRLFGKQAGTNGYWRWWSIPFGLPRTEVWSSPKQDGWLEIITLSKGNVTRNEGYLSTVIMEVLFVVYLIFKTFVF